MGDQMMPVQEWSRPFQPGAIVLCHLGPPLQLQVPSQVLTLDDIEQEPITNNFITPQDSLFKFTTKFTRVSFAEIGKPRPFLVLRDDGRLIKGLPGTSTVDKAWGVVVKPEAPWNTLRYSTTFVVQQMRAVAEERLIYDPDTGKVVALGRVNRRQLQQVYSLIVRNYRYS